ncbi:MAG: (d)CMP kinase [Candidatus Marinimicrobia bacterium]|jgi:cytidylate kinase|nr:(d)CMP kinase [Candidatus Neomarinimicrobiota bacterium]
MVIAIDGPAGSGKTTTAKEVAKELGFIHINTGAMYRGIALKCLKEEILPENESGISHILDNTTLDFGGLNKDELLLDGVNVASEITSSDVAQSASKYSTIRQIRERLVDYQRRLSHGKDVVLEGRDIGTVVFPDAEFKFFLIADVEERAKRRLKDLSAKGEKKTLNALIEEIKQRDFKDTTRKNSPLRKAEDAIEVDTTQLSLEGQVQRIIEIVKTSIT